MARYLIVCDGGNVRSHALSTVLKLDHKQEAIAAGRLFLTPETMAMLSGWADHIVVVQPHMIESVPEEYRGKVVCADFGPDVWGIAMVPGLFETARAFAGWLTTREAVPA